MMMNMMMTATMMVMILERVQLHQLGSSTPLHG